MTTWDPLMSRYCKAYPAERFSDFAGWPKPDNTLPDAVFFVHDDFLVTTGALRKEEDIILKGDEPGWREFARGELGFDIPEDIRDATSADA